ncbi:MAG: hypothetical protein M0Z94_01235, partial [Dehalococcoidales bacterium]|nr:hypothetical protein [Dehalococcoidales bacterium]
GTSKAAVTRISKGAATALYRPHGICVSMLRPVGMPTPMYEAVGRGDSSQLGMSPEEAVRKRAAEFLFGRFEQIEHHAEVLAWLAVAPPDDVNGKIVSTWPFVSAD